jgi:subtilase family serine protease
MATRSTVLGVIIAFAATACAPTGSAFPGSSGAGISAPNAVTLQPDHGASSLPGGWLPCGFPPRDGEGGDGLLTTTTHLAQCTVAIDRTRTQENLVAAAAIQGLHPDDIVNAYNLPSANAGMRVAIVDAFDDPNAESDLATYRAKFGLPACTSANGCFVKMNQRGKRGSYPRVDRPWSFEMALDTEMVSAVCPHCSILLVEADSSNIDDLGAAVDEAVARGARIVSNSYYAHEWSGEITEDVHYNHPGVAITASSGDVSAQYGGGGGDAIAAAHSKGPYYPATSPYVTAVGGTSLRGNPNAWTQTPWRYEGRGCSRYEPLPSFQPGICPTRAAVDMAVEANPETGVALYSKGAGGWIVGGGTSVGAPLIAAAYALSGRPEGPAYSYAHRDAFRGIGVPGFDLVTGLGSPRGIAGL